MNLIQSLEHPAKASRVLKLMQDIMSSGQYAEGAVTAKAESMVAELYGPRAIAFNSCGSALFAAFRYYESLGIKAAYIQNNTFHATGAMALEAGLTPILVDSREDCPSMALESLKANVATYKGEAQLVVLTHVAGWLAKDYAAIAEYCDENNLILLEDCAHAFGLGLSGSLRPGSLGHAACWSFYPTKAVPIGEGGMLTTGDAHLATYAERFRQYGKHKVDGFICYQTGFNMRMSEWDAAVLVAQLESLPNTMLLRRRDAAKLQSIAPCLLTGESNFYKFPVSSKYESLLKTVGKVYLPSDQLASTLPRKLISHSLANSTAWAAQHCCLPVGEGLYSNMTQQELVYFLEK